MSQMLRKKEAFTLVTPIPGFIPRQLAIDILHSHSEVIRACKGAVAEEYCAIVVSLPTKPGQHQIHSTGYQGSGDISYSEAASRMVNGRTRTETFPVDIPFTRVEAVQSDVPINRAYLLTLVQEGKLAVLPLTTSSACGELHRLHSDSRPNFLVSSESCGQWTYPSLEMVQRIIKKAELLDAGVLKAMMEDGKLKTVNPNDRSTTPAVAAMSPHSRQPSVNYGIPGQKSPQMPPSYSPAYPHYAYPSPQQSQPPQLYDPRQSMYSPNPQQGQYAPPPIPPKEQMVIMELPGDYPTQYAQPVQGQSLYGSPLPSPGYRPPSASSSDPRWSQGQPSPSLLNPHRMSSGSTSSAGQHHGFVNELSAHPEKSEY
ncbi:hypothetical protein M440DRAFT_1446525 [Trichoderma longibrachiatum ATCC 18648]|uniref:DUF7053 domain-containing protein n=1 Tax=Trichoderma longibrachiatum ATCC 18648 TaxID=983965 RepID=A0A2T4BX91_TRILO|nr:hypothetical protein M440DRAFT_1446525 [Trichoderma longibrachiatum ATCC 18648]